MCSRTENGVSVGGVGLSVVLAVGMGVFGFLAGRGVIPVPGLEKPVKGETRQEAPTMGVTKAEADRNASGTHFWTRSKGHGGHYYIVVDFPDARGQRQSSYIHDPSCPCGAK